MSVFEWLGRVIMLVLAGMVTLSIIGAIAAIPSGILPERIGMTERRAPVPEAEPTPAPEPRRDRASPEGAPGATTDQVSIAPAEPEPVDPAEWLEAIFYALLALVGIAALATVILWRMLHQRRRIADALEAISRAPAAIPSPPSRASASG
jgi:hypothetical protein